MVRKKIYIGCIMVSLLILLAGCIQKPKPPQGTEEPPKEVKPPAPELVEILPTDTGAQYFYNGFAEYGHVQLMDRVDEEDGKKIYHVTGMVDDLSGGEATGNFTVEMQYIVDADTITEKITQGEKLPHKIPELEVLRLPLAKGNTWDQKMIINGKEETLKATIETVGTDPDDNIETYTVVYTVPMENMPDGTYKEVRTYKKGVGLYHFENTIGKEYDFMFTYTLSLIEKK